jgi:hypothetical protein
MGFQCPFKTIKAYNKFAEQKKGGRKMEQNRAMQIMEQGNT